MLKRNDFQLHTLQISAAFGHSIPRFSAHMGREAEAAVPSESVGTRGYDQRAAGGVLRGPFTGSLDHGFGCLGTDLTAIAKNFWWRVVFFHAARWQRFFRCCRGRLQLPIPLGLNLLLMPGEHLPEAFGLEEYKAGRLTEAQLRHLLGFPTRQELDGFLKAHEVWLNYTLEDLERDRAALKRLGFGN